MESKFSIQKLNKRVEKYIWQPSTKEGNPLYRKGLDQVSHEQIFTEETKNDAEFKNTITKRFTSPNNVRALFLFDNLGITVLHHGIGTDIEQNKNTGKITIKRGSETGRVLEEHASEKNLIKIGRSKDQAPDKLMFGTVSGATTDSQGNSAENFEYEEINAITDTHRMPIARFYKWQMQNIEEIYFDIMYTLNDLQGKAGDRKIDIKEVVKSMFNVNDIEKIKAMCPRLKYIGFIKHTSELNEAIKSRQLVEKIREVQQDKTKSIIEQIPEIKGSVDRQNFIEFGGNEKRYNTNIADWLYDYLLQQENEKADQQENRAVAQQEEDNVKGFRDVTEKFLPLWNQTGKRVVVRKATTEKAKSYPSEIDKEYPLSIFDVVQVGSKGLVAIEDKSYIRLEKKSYLSDNYNFEEGKDTGLFSIREGVKYAVVQIPPEEKVYVRRNGFTYKLNVKASNGDYLVCRMVNGEPVSTEVWVETGLWFDTYYENYVKDNSEELVDKMAKKVKELHDKGANFEGIAFYILSSLEKENNIKELCIKVYKKVDITIPDKMKSLIYLSKYLQNAGLEDFTNEIRNEIKVG